ncbi:MAG: hypothetical protein ACI8PZ_006422 [Myxococcota bacterium]
MSQHIDPDAPDPVEDTIAFPLARLMPRSGRVAAVPLMLFVSSMLMAVAWLGHLLFKESHFLVALLACWLIVFPEYVLNVAAVRVGKGIYSGATMASFNLCTGVVCVVLVSRFVLGEEMDVQQYAGFGIMLVAMALIGAREHDSAAGGSADASEEAA